MRIRRLLANCFRYCAFHTTYVDVNDIVNSFASPAVSPELALTFAVNLELHNLWFVARGYLRDGGLLVNQADVNLIQNVIVGNVAGAGAGISWSVPSNTRGPYIVNNTVYGNMNNQSCEQFQGSALYIEGFDNQSVLANNLFVGFKGQNAVWCDSTFSQIPPIVQSNDAVSSGGSSFGDACAGATGKNGNLSINPQFVNPTRNNYRLKSTSPAIDKGNNAAPDLPSKDFAGNPRIVAGQCGGTKIIDMGTYEFQPQCGSK